MKYFATTVNKNQPTIRIPFAEPFQEPPVVLASPFLLQENTPFPIGGVGGVPTITDIATDAVTLTDSNAASNYYLNILAIDAKAQSLDGLPVTVGSYNKNATN